MSLFALVRILFARASSRAAWHGSDDPADMGTAFGLDVTTTLEAETPGEITSRLAAQEGAASTPRLAHRLHRRSTF